MDKTYIKLAGRCNQLQWAGDREGDAIGCQFAATSDCTTPERFRARANALHGESSKISVGTSGVNAAVISSDKVAQSGYQSYPQGCVSIGLTAAKPGARPSRSSCRTKASTFRPQKRKRYSTRMRKAARRAAALTARGPALAICREIVNARGSIVFARRNAVGGVDIVERLAADAAADIKQPQRFEGQRA